MGAHHLNRARGPNPRGDVRASFDNGAQPEIDGSDEETVDLWSVPGDVGVTPPATDLMLAEWAGILRQDGDAKTAPGEERWPDSPAASGPVDPDAPPPHRSGGAPPGLASTVLVSAIISALVGLAALPVIGLLIADIRIAGPDRSSIGSTTTDDRVVVRDPSGDCLTMLVKPRKAGTTAKVNGTCFSVG